MPPLSLTSGSTRPLSPRPREIGPPLESVPDESEEGIGGDLGASASRGGGRSEVRLPPPLERDSGPPLGAARRSGDRNRAWLPACARRQPGLHGGGPHLSRPTVVAERRRARPE